MTVQNRKGINMPVRELSFQRGEFQVDQRQLQQVVDDAFLNVERPLKFTSECPCDECAGIEAKFRCTKDRELPNDLAWELPLLSSAAIQFLMPTLIRTALSDSEDDLVWNFVEKLCTPISKSNPPDSLPFACNFTLSQFQAVLQFLEFVQANWYEASDEIPREIPRGIRNWRHLSERAAR